MKQFLTLFLLFAICLNFQAQAPSSSVLTGTATICAGTSTNLSVAVTGGVSPYTVTVTDGTNNYSATSASPVSIPVSPTSTSTYNIVSVTGGGTGSGNTGSATVTVSPAVSVSISVNGTTPLPALEGGGSTTICANSAYAMTLLDITQGTGPVTFVYNVRENNINGAILQGNVSTGAIAAGGTIYSAAAGVLSAGTYFIETLSITDANGCQVQPMVMGAGYYNHTLVVNEAVEVAISVNGTTPLPATQGGGSTTICANSAYAMTLLAINQGTGPVTFLYNVRQNNISGAILQGNVSSGAIAAGGTIYSAAAGVLSAGTYFIETLSITDANGCQVQPMVMGAGYYNHTLVVNEAVEVAISVNGTTPLPATQGGGSTTICANSAYAMTLLAINQGTGPVTFLYNVRQNNISGAILQGNVSSGAIAAGGTIYSAAAGALSAGTYFIQTLSITDANGCQVQPVVMGAGYYNHTLVVNEAVEVAISVNGTTPLPATQGGGSTTICANSAYAMTLLAINQGTGPVTFLYNVRQNNISGAILQGNVSTGAIAAGGTIYSAAAGALSAGTYFIQTLSITDANGCQVQPVVMGAGYYNHTLVVNEAVEVAISVNGTTPLPATQGGGSTTICANSAYAMTLLAINQGTGPVTFLYNVRQNNISGAILQGNVSSGAIAAGGTIYSAAAGALSAGTYFIQTLSITDANGCQVQPMVMGAGYYNHTLTVNPTPVISNFTNTICTGSANTVVPVGSNSNILPLGTLYTWTVSPGAVTGSSASSSQASFPLQTLVNPTNAPVNVTYTVTPYFSNQSVTCTGSTFTDIVTVGPTITIGTQNAQICSGESFLVTPVNSLLGNVIPNNVQYTWSAPLVSGISGTATEYNASNISGTLTNLNATSTDVIYSVIPFVVNGGECLGSAFNVVVNVSIGLPSVSVGVDQPFCSNVSATFTATLQDALFGSWSTSGTGIFAPNVTNTSISYTPSAADITAGIVNISYTATNACGTNHDTAILTLNTAPSTSAGLDATICNAANTTLSASGATSYAWSPSTGLSATNTASVTATPAATTTYTVTGTNANGCTSTDQVVVNVVNAPSATITASAATVCVGTSTTLSANSGTGFTYSWSDGTSVVGTTQSLVVSPSASTNYTVTVTNSTGCSITSSATAITVTPLPVATISGTAVVCAGTSTTLTASSGSSYLWNTGATTASITVTPTSTTYYSVTVTSNGCSATSSVTTVTVNPLPVVSITGSTTVCAGSTTTLTSATPSGGWTSSNIAVATVSSGGVVTGVSSSTSTITYTVTTNGCSTSVSSIITVNPLPVLAAIGGTTSACIGSTTSLTNTTSGGTWTSATPAVATVNSITGQVSSVSAGSSLMTYTYTNTNGCTSSVTAAVTINALTEVAAITGTTSACVGSTTTLTSALASGVWTSSNTATATVNASTGVVTGIAAGSTTITYTVTNSSGCISSVTTTVTINPVPSSPIISGAESICLQSLNQIFSTNLTPNLLNWQIDGGTIYSGQYTNEIHIDAIATDTMFINLTEQILNTGCSTTSSFIVLIDNNATAPSYVNLTPSPQNDFLFSPQGTDVFRWGKIDKQTNDIYYYLTTNIYHNFIQIDTSNFYYFVDHGQTGCFTRSYYIYPAPISSLEEQEINLFSISPNPVTSEFIISSFLYQNIHVVIQDIKGDVVYDGNSWTNSSIDFSNSKPGIYFVNILNSNKLTYFKLLKL